VQWFKYLRGRCVFRPLIPSEARDLINEILSALRASG